MHIDGDIVPSERVIAGLDTDPQIIHDIRPQNEVILGISGNSRFFNYYFRCYPSRGTELDELENYVSCASVGKFTSICHHGCDQPCPVEFVLFLFINFLRTIEFLHPEFRKKTLCHSDKSIVVNLHFLGAGSPGAAVQRGRF